MAADGAWTRDVPTYGTGNVQNDCDEIKENFAYVERLYHILTYMLLDDYYADFTYTGDDLTGISVKNGSAVEQAACTLTYATGTLTTEAWTINSKTLTYSYTYSGGNLTKVALNIT